MFIRVHEHLYVPVNKIKRLESFNAGKTLVVMDDGMDYYADRPLSTFVEELDALTGIFIQGGLQAD